MDTRASSIQRTLTRQGSAHEPVFAGPKTARSCRIITLTRTTTEFLKDHRASQNEERVGLGVDYAKFDLVFCTGLGTPLSERNVLRSLKLTLRQAAWSGPDQSGRAIPGPMVPPAPHGLVVGGNGLLQMAPQGCWIVEVALAEAASKLRANSPLFVPPVLRLLRALGNLLQRELRRDRLPIEKPEQLCCDMPRDLLIPGVGDIAGTVCDQQIGQSLQGRVEP